ncbi:hypothetical protein NM208_g5048 [Fusarium decemcellulare]|uniref:Uncharacterized protein n=1 Tax=Fusarium decemcellulare TaxID=57161 RepID=A0ACC1SIP1_9HYPO|nr:hypothetical protein NM208_g5048 [Fusarium decemcellulare]
MGLIWGRIFILPIQYQSGDIAFSEWITLLTLCLTPLVAHILVGAPLPTYLDTSRPKWHDRVCHYNPTSILWRYAMIADRWFRAKEWDKADLAATNALFWTSKGWNGDEDMIDRARPHCVRLPDGVRTSLFSGETVGTVIITCQGAQAVFVLANGLAGVVDDGFVRLMAVDKIFFPLAVIGLLRIWACPILTNEFSYVSQELGNQSSRSDGCSGEYLPLEHISRDNLVPGSRRFRPIRSWPGILFRTAYFLCILGLLALTSCYLSGGYYTSTTFVLAIFYLVFLAVTILIFAWYFAFRRVTTTIIPCIASTWYKIYTGMLALLGVSLLVISCIETRRTPCGKFTSGGPSADLMACLGATSDLVLVGGSLNNSAFGSSANYYTKANNGTFIQVGPTDTEQRVTNFTGMCFGDGLQQDKTTEVILQFYERTS